MDHGLANRIRSDDDKAAGAQRPSAVSTAGGRPNRPKSDNIVPAADETQDWLFDGRIKLYQSRTGYRLCLDAVLLAHFLRVKARESIVDLGAGNGAIALMLAYLHPSARLTAVEIQSAMLARARYNSVLNGFEDRLTILAGDVRAVATLAEPGHFNAAVCNPPYRAPRSGRVSPDAEKRIARHELIGGLAHFLRAGNYLLAHKGRMAMIYPAMRTVDLVTAMRGAGIEPKRFRMVHSFADAEASLVMVEGVKGGGSEIAVEPPLIIYDRKRQYGSEVAAMLAGQKPRLDASSSLPGGPNAGREPPS